jgi:outer membrane protein assembly factor BamD (BamD/ComL family)
MKKLLIAFVSLILALAYCSESQQQKNQSEQIDNKGKQAEIESEEKLFEMAAKAEAANRFDEAIRLYDTIIDKYPDSPRVDKALFMSGYINYEYLNNKDEAMVNFQRVLDEYPNSDLTDDADFMIKAINQGKDALRTFEDNNANK